MPRTRTSRKQGLAVEPIMAETPDVQAAQKKQQTRSKPQLSKSVVPDDAQFDLEGAKENNLAAEGKPKAKVNTRKRKNEDVNSIPPESSQPTQPPHAKRMKAVQPPGPNTSQPKPRQKVRPRATAAPTQQEKRKRRTKEEMLADKAKAEADKLQLQQEAKQNQERLVMMDIEEDASQLETAARMIRKFGDIENDSGSGLEEFPGYHDIGSDSDTESEEDGVDLVEERALKEANKSIQQTKQKSGGKINAGGQKERFGGKKTSQTAAVYASGLRKNWNEHPAQKKKTSVKISAGGLSESDIDDVNPFISHSNHVSGHSVGTNPEDNIADKTQKAGSRDHSRQNTLVTIVNDAGPGRSDDENEFVPPAIAKKAAAKVPRPAQMKPKPKPQNQVEALEVADQNTRVKAVASGSRKKIGQRLNGNNVRISDLPEFAIEKWRSTFLPTLYNKFFTSDEPFDAFNSGSVRFVALLQTIMGEVYPDVKYTVTAMDAIHFLAYNRINEKRSSIGSSAIKLIENHLKSLTSHEAQRDWLQWARRADGPLFFQVPAPQWSPLRQSDPKYQYPSGRMLSPFIIDLAKPLFALCKGSVSTNGYLKTLFALIMAALERAVGHLSKPSVPLLEFSKPHWGSQISIYSQGFSGHNGVPDERWEELDRICGRLPDSNGQDDDDCDADMSLLDNNRAFIFGFASPVKSRA